MVVGIGEILRFNRKCTIVVGLLFAVIFFTLIMVPSQANDDSLTKETISQTTIDTINSEDTIGTHADTLMSITLTSGVSQADTITVCSSGCDYTSIQAAIDNASVGDTIIVYNGTYYENIHLKDGVKVQGEGADVTIIDGGGAGSVVTAIGVGHGTVLDGFSITNGSPEYWGGGIYIKDSSPVIANNTIEGNSAVSGAGIYISKTYYYPECSPNITHNVIQNNDASQQQGGGISVNFASPTINNNIIRGNIAENGGGVHIDHSFCTIANNDISGNSAPLGGAICMTVSDGSIVNNRIVDNTASHEVGGIFMWGSSPIMVCNTIANNSAPIGGGIYCEAESSPTIFNSILWGNGDDLFSCSATYSDIEDGDPGEGNICADPMFVNAASGDYHLQSTQGSYHGGAWTPDADTSPCIDAGDPTSVYDNEPEPNGNRINMGAYGNTSQASKSPLFSIFQAQTDKITYALYENVIISCIVQNETGYNITADSVKAEILKPDSSIERVIMLEELVGHYNGTFTNTSLNGIYHITIHANKTGYDNDTAELWFEVSTLVVVIDTSPENMATNVEIDTNITATFSALMNSSTLNNNTVKVYFQDKIVGETFEDTVGTWNSTNFQGFIYTEQLKILPQLIDDSHRTIGERNISYSTQPLLKDYLIYTNEGEEVEDSGNYTIIGWQGNEHVVIVRGSSKWIISRLIFEQNSTDVKTLQKYENWNLGDGYSFEVLDISESDPEAFVALYNSSGKINDVVCVNQTACIFSVDLDTVADAPIFVTYLNKVNTTHIELKYTWLISQDTTVIQNGQPFGDFRAMTMSDKIILDNDEDVILSEGDTIPLFDDFKFEVEDTPTVRYRLVHQAEPPLEGDVSYNSSSNTVIFDPVSNLNENTDYFPLITTGAEDLAGNGLTEDYIWTFRTINAIPIAILTQPEEGAYIRGTIDINGTANDTNFYNYIIEWKNTTVDWIEIHNSTVPVSEGTLATWNTDNLEDGDYSIRLTVADNASNSNITMVNVKIDNTPPVINTVTLDTTTPNAGDDILVTVNTTDDIVVTNVTANSIDLYHQDGDIWNGTITALGGTHFVNVSGRDAAGNIGWNNSTSYTALTTNVTFIITDNSTGTPDSIEGATVSLKNTKNETDAYGTAIFTNVAFRDYKYQVRMKGYKRTAGIISVNDYTTVKEIELVPKK